MEKLTGVVHLGAERHRLKNNNNNNINNNTDNNVTSKIPDTALV